MFGKGSGVGSPRRKGALLSANATPPQDERAIACVIFVKKETMKAPLIIPMVIIGWFYPLSMFKGDLESLPGRIICLRHGADAGPGSRHCQAGVRYAFARVNGPGLA